VAVSLLGRVRDCNWKVRVGVGGEEMDAFDRGYVEGFEIFDRQSMYGKGNWCFCLVLLTFARIRTHRRKTRLCETRGFSIWK